MKHYSTNNNNGSSGGIGFAGLLTIVFIVLKLVGIIDWSWWWVLCPIWALVAISLIVIAIAAIVIAFHDDDYRGNNKWKF